MTKSTFKISAQYWEKLSDQEKQFMQVNACARGVSYCKRILSLAKNFPGWDNLVSADHYLQMRTNAFIVFKGDQMIGMISKSVAGFGITERISIHHPGGGFIDAWNNWSESNPNAKTKKNISEAMALASM